MRVLPVPVDPTVVVTPLTALLNASRIVMVKVERVAPFAVTPVLGVLTRVEFAADAAPGIKVTVPSLFVTGEVIWSVFISA